MRVAIIGVGLIGGSIAKDLQSKGYSKLIIGVDANEEHCRIALETNLVDQILGLKEAILKAELIILSTPVEVSKRLLPEILDQIEDRVVVDVCSTKKSLSNIVKHHKSRGRYVAAHPMAGTEYSGPMAAVLDLFRNKTNIICEKEWSDVDALEKAMRLFDALEMNTSFMGSEEHDVHAANVSHLSHVSSFALALSVLKIEKNNIDEIKIMAAGGFRSTVRLAKSDARIWEEILLDNSENVLDALEIYFEELEKFKLALQTRNSDELQALIRSSNHIGSIVDAISKRNSLQL